MIAYFLLFHLIYDSHCNVEQKHECEYVKDVKSKNDYKNMTLYPTVTLKQLCHTPTHIKISRVGQNGIKCLFIFKMLVECLSFSPWRKLIWVRTPGVSFVFIKFSIKFWAYWYMDSFGEVSFLIFKNWLKIFKNWLKSQKWNYWKIHSKSGKNRSPI